MKLKQAVERSPLGTKTFMHGPYLQLYTDRSPAFSNSCSVNYEGIRLWLFLLTVSIGLATGCSSAISMREALRDSIEQAASVSQFTVISDIETNSSDETLFDEAATASYAPKSPSTPEYLDEDQFDRGESQDVSLDIETAVSTLSQTGVLNAASKAALVETLEMTPEADWPIVIEEFTTTLNTLRVTETAPALYTDTSTDAPEIKRPGADDPSSISAYPANPEEVATSEVTPDTFTVSSLDTVSSAIGDIENNYDSEAVASSSSQPPPAELFAETKSDQTTGTETSPSSEIGITDDTLSDSLQEQQNSLVIQRPCIAQKVLGWGMVEAFPQNKIFPGSEVIVYFELTGIESKNLDQGFETSIETTLRIDDEAGKRLHSWSFPPLVEVCASIRRDYFARFFVSLPSTLPPGDHQLVLTVTDSHAGTTAETVLPFGIAPSGSASSTAK